MGVDDDVLIATLADHDALSVTMPLKHVVMSHCDELSETARRVGVVNSVCRRGGELHGAATDGEGLLRALEHDFSASPLSWRVLVRGSGGSARSIIDALAARDAEVLVVCRRPEEVGDLARRYRNVGVNVDPGGTLDLVINTVPLEAGDTSSLDAYESDFEAITHAYDVLYEPRRTPWLARHEELGATCSNGLSMLVFQAQLQLEWWFEREVPLAALMAAVTS